MATSSNHEPFFLRFRRELIHHEKSALSNPAQLLRLLTGQEHLHHRFILVSDKQNRVATSNPRSSNTKSLASSQGVGNRHDKAFATSTSATTTESRQDDDFNLLESMPRHAGLLKMIHQLEHSEVPVFADRLLLDIVLGTGRVVDDLRTLANLRKVLPCAVARLAAIKRIILSLIAGISGFQAACANVTDANIMLLVESLSVLSADLEQDIISASREQLRARKCKLVRRWVRNLGIGEETWKDRELQTLVCSKCACAIPFDEGSCASALVDHIVHQNCGAMWSAVFGARAPARCVHSASKLEKLAFRLLLLADIVLSDEFTDAVSAQHMSAVAKAHKCAFDILREARPGASSWELQLSCLGSELHPVQRLLDPRVPWPADNWQVKLLDAVDAQCGALVLAPTSAGKTFAAYYVMEVALRSSNTAAVLCVMPTLPLAAQVEAEVHARFAQKPYPHDGFTLCAALIPGRKRSLIKSAQIIITTPELLDVALGDDELWSRLQWAVCDEIHMVALNLVKALSMRCGRSGVPLLAMSATVQHPQRLRERLAQSTRSPRFQLVQHSERVVDLHSFRWIGARGGLRRLHPLSFVETGRPIPHMPPEQAFEIWRALSRVIPSLAAQLAPREWFLRFRYRGLCRKLENNLNIISLISHLVGERMISRREFRQWERRLATCLGDISTVQVASLLQEVDPASVVSGEKDADLGPVELLQLLQAMKNSDLLPCICFHRSASRTETLSLGLAEVLDRVDRQRKEEARERTKEWHAEQRAVYERKLDDLREKLEQARMRAAGRDRGEDAASSQQVVEDKWHRIAVALVEHASDRVPLSDAWGYTGQSDRQPSRREVRSALQARKKVESDPHVRAARAALEALKECPPDLEGPQLAPDCDFMAERTRHVYGTEIQMLIAHVERGLKSLAASRGQLWSQAMISALHHGVAMHFADSGCEGVNFAVQLLFRMGHVRILLADESVGCGINLPCRSTVILDREIQGAALTQMAGRAGRRGLDMWGATVFVHNLETLREMHGSITAATRQSNPADV